MTIDRSEFTVHGGDYEHTLELSGSYQGVHVAYQPMRVQDIFGAMLETRRFEICEFSLANYLTLRGTGQHWLTALPVFPSRAFRHNLAVTRRESALTRLDQLANTRVGVEDYSMTAAVWFRGLLHDEHGIDHRSITWVTRPKQRFAFPADAKVETTGTDLEDLTCSGALDATLGMTLRDNTRPPNERRLRTVLADPQTEERDYYRRTSIYPIMHCVVIRNDVLEQNRKLADIIYEAYANAKAQAYRRQLGASLVPWGKVHWARTFEVFGGDPLPYGLTPGNRRTIERLAGYLVRQGFIPEAPNIDSLFAVPTRL